MRKESTQATPANMSDLCHDIFTHNFCIYARNAHAYIRTNVSLRAHRRFQHRCQASYYAQEKEGDAQMYIRVHIWVICTHANIHLAYMNMCIATGKQDIGLLQYACGREHMHTTHTYPCITTGKQGSYQRPPICMSARTGEGRSIRGAANCWGIRIFVCLHVRPSLNFLAHVHWLAICLHIFGRVNLRALPYINHVSLFPSPPLLAYLSQVCHYIHACMAPFCVTVNFSLWAWAQYVSHEPALVFFQSRVLV